MKFLATLILAASLVMRSDGKASSDTLDIKADLSLERAERFFESNEYDKALYHYSLAANDYKAQKLWKGYVTAIAGKASTLIKQRKYDNAKITLDTALSVGKKFLGESPEVATVYYVYGILYDFMNRADQALAMHDAGLRMRQELLGTQHVKVAESYNGIGEVYRYSIRDYVEAEKNFLRSIKILENVPGAGKKNLYRGYYNLATTNRLKNDFEKALGYAFNAVQALESIKPPDTTTFIRCYGIIANIYNDQYAFDNAILYYRKALSLRLARKEVSSETANDYNNLSVAYTRIRNLSMALHCVDSALQIMAQEVDFDSAGIAFSYMLKGRVLREAEQLGEAIQNYHRSLAIQKRYSKRNVLDISDLYRHLSETMYKSEQFDSALYYVQESIQTAIGEDTKLSHFSNPPYESLVNKPQLYFEMAHKGAVLVKLSERDETINRLSLALECFKLSDRLMDVYWDFQETENSKLLFVQNNYYIYEMALASIYKLYSLTADEKYKEAAFQLQDKSKARILRKGVEEAKEHAKRHIPDSLLSQERSIKISIASLQNRLGSLERNKDSDAERALNMELMASQKDLAEWKEKIMLRFPQYAIDPKSPTEMSLRELQKNLGDEMIFIEYFFGENVVYAFASFQGRQRLISIENKKLQERIHSFCRLLSNGLQGENRVADFSTYTTLAFELYNDLLSPAFKALGVNPEEDGQQMLVIPDGVLSLLPFQALITSKPKSENVDYKHLNYLVRHFAISYSFDAASPFNSSRSSLGRKNLLAFGWSDGIERTPNDLPGTYQELSAIADIIPGKFLMGSKASKSAFMEEAPHYNILHLAIHGVGNDDDIYNNYLQFRDEKLYAHELYGYQLDAKLTVLSACQTGYGKVFTAEGVYSIARGFFYAGSRSLLMTLWPINDGENVQLIRQFYKSLDQKEPSSKALSKSQLDYLEHADEYTSHPRFWAGLVLWGSYKEVSERSILGILRFGIIFILLTTLGYWLFRKTRQLSRAKRSNAY